MHNSFSLLYLLGVFTRAHICGGDHGNVQLELHMDVVDDLVGEATEVRPSFTPFCRPHASCLSSPPLPSLPPLLLCARCVRCIRSTAG